MAGAETVDVPAAGTSTVNPETELILYVTITGSVIGLVKVTSGAVAPLHTVALPDTEAVAVGLTTTWTAELISEHEPAVTVLLNHVVWVSVPGE